jgi:hypothetical protein
MKKKEVKPDIINGAEKTEIQKILEQQERQALIFSPEAFLPQKNIDKELEKFQLLSGVETSWKELREAHFKYMRFIAAKKRDYAKTFPPEIYSEWRRLNGWDKKPHQKHQKPFIFSVYTVLFVYGRFPKEILPTLEDLNKFIYPGIRLYKHFELLTDEGYEDVKSFIQDVIKVAGTCSDMYEFRVKYAAKFGTPFCKTVAQLNVFRDNDSILSSI